jgi:type VI protein secretion system component VasF
MARPERLDVPEPPVDTTAAVRHAYRFHRAKRRVRDDRRLRQRYAGVRFAFTLALLVFAFVVLSLTIWNEIQRAFGL